MRRFTAPAVWSLQRSSPRAVPGFVPVAALIAATQFSWTAMVPILPTHATSLGADAAGVGVVVAGFGLGRLLMDVPAGVIAGRASASAALSLGAAGVAGTTLIAGAAGSLASLTAVRVAMGLTAGLALTSGMAVVAHLTAAGGRGRMVSRLQLVQLTATTLGPLAGGFIADRWSTGVAFACAGAIGLVVAGAALPVLPSGAEVRARGRVRTPEDAPDGERSTTGMILVASSIGFAIFLARFGGEQTLVPLLGAERGLGVSGLGMLLGGLSVCQGIGVVLSGRLYDRLSRRWIVGAATAVVAVCLVVLTLLPTAGGFAAAVLLLGVAQGVAVPASSAYLMDVSTPQRMGVSVGVYRGLGDLAGALGPPAVGVLVLTAGYVSAALALSACVATIAAVFTWRAADPAVRHAASPESP